MTAPIYLTPFVLFADSAIIVAVLGVLRLALLRTNWPRSRRRSIMTVASIVLVGWFLLALMLAYAGVYRGVADRLPTIQFGIFVPIFVGLWLLWRSATVADVINAIPQSWLVAIQLYRALGVIFIVLLNAGRLPPQFALPAGCGDVAVGLFAPLVAYAYACNIQGSKTAVVAWNIFGLADLVIAVGTGFLTSPSPLQQWALGAPNELISAFPLVMVPVFAVPLSVLLHVASLTKLARTGAHVAPHNSNPHAGVLS